MLIISSAEFDAFFLGGYQECFSVDFFACNGSRNTYFWVVISLVLVHSLT